MPQLSKTPPTPPSLVLLEHYCTFIRVRPVFKVPSLVTKKDYKSLKWTTKVNSQFLNRPKCTRFCVQLIFTIHLTDTPKLPC